jgi:hypothetical protein
MFATKISGIENLNDDSVRKEEVDTYVVIRNDIVSKHSRS